MELFKKFGIFVMAMATVSVVDFGSVNLSHYEFNFISSAEARVGRPLTPISAGGVARRTTRRVIRYGAYVATLPVGCVPYTPYYQCGTVYYQPVVQNNTTTYVTVILED
jgi:hypothetical protein